MKAKLLFIITLAFLLFGITSNVNATEQEIEWIVGGSENNSLYNVLLAKSISSEIVNNITEIHFYDITKENIEINNNSIEIDLSKDSDNKIVAKIDNNTMYILYEGTLYLNEDSSYVFAHFNNVKSIKGLENINTSRVKNMESMFFYVGSSANELYIGDLSGWDTSNVTNMRSMFHCAGKNATTWNIGDISKWDTSNVINMRYMFYSVKVKELYLSNWNTSKVKDMNYMFDHCSSLIKLDLTNFTFSEELINNNAIFKLYDCKMLSWFKTPDFNGISVNLPYTFSAKEYLNNQFDYINTDDIYTKGTIIRRVFTFSLEDNSNRKVYILYGNHLYNIPSVKCETGYCSNNEWYLKRVLNEETNTYELQNIIIKNSLLDENLFKHDIYQQKTIKLYCECVKKKYKVTFLNYDNKVLKEATEYEYKTKAQDIVKPPNPTRENTAEYTYIFNGWTPMMTDVTKDITYKAVFLEEKNKYKVTFVDDDNTVLKETTEYYYGTKDKDIEKPSNPTKEAEEPYIYIFTGWTPEIEPVIKDVTYKATYSKTAQYTVTFNTNGGNEIPSQIVMHLSSAIEPLVPTKNGYNFIGWYLDEELTTPYDFTSPVDNNITLYAKWEEIQYIPVYRMYNPRNGEHLYTTDANEVDVIYRTQGWGKEGIGWYSSKSGIPVYRLYSPKFDNHLYTSDKNEMKIITTQYGWVFDNVRNGEPQPVMYSNGETKIYRLYNPGQNDQHHLTTDENEYNIIPKWGWRQEGVAMKAAKIGKPEITHYYK